MATHNLEDLLDEIDEDAVIEILEDTNELGGLLKAIAANYRHDPILDHEALSWLSILQAKAYKIREELVRKKYPLMSNDPRD